jgi:mRNA-degrading endonuclease toxin of MazEF toxin-antitoxin module
MTPRYRAGDNVIVDWRDALPKEANKQRPAVVVEDSALFDESHPNVVLVPLADDPRLAIADLSVPIEPTDDNGCTKPCRALAHNVTATSKRRCRATGGRITDGQFDAIRRRIAETIGL